MKMTILFLFINTFVLRSDWSRCLFGFLVCILEVGVVLVLEHGLDVAPDQGQEQGHAQAGGDQVEEGGLGVLVHVHHEYCRQEAGQVCCKTLL